MVDQLLQLTLKDTVLFLQVLHPLTFCVDRPPVRSGLREMDLKTLSRFKPPGIIRAFGSVGHQR
jgi:hypothetical protein